MSYSHVFPAVPVLTVGMDHRHVPPANSDRRCFGSYRSGDMPTLWLLPCLAYQPLPEKSSPYTHDIVHVLTQSWLQYQHKIAGLVGRAHEYQTLVSVLVSWFLLHFLIFKIMVSGNYTRSYRLLLLSLRQDTFMFILAFLIYVEQDSHRSLP